MGIICDTCGRDIDALGQDNMGVGAPLCEDCWGEQQSHTVAVPRREARNQRFENARLREKLDAGTEETAVQNLCKGIETARPRTPPCLASRPKRRTVSRCPT